MPQSCLSGFVALLVKNSSAVSAGTAFAATATATAVVIVPIQLRPMVVREGDRTPDAFGQLRARSCDHQPHRLTVRAERVGEDVRTRDDDLAGEGAAEEQRVALTEIEVRETQFRQRGETASVGPAFPEIELEAVSAVTAADGSEIDEATREFHALFGQTER